MIKAVTVTNYLGDSIRLELARPELSGFAITSITGLGPGKATVNASEISTIDGGFYNSARLSARNIVIAIKYLWKDTIEEARHRSYKYFPIKKKVTLLFETDTRTAQIEGYVEANDPTIFSDKEGSDISIICPDPLFYSTQMSTTVFSGIEPMFEFPFSNESLSENMLIMGSIENAVEKVIVYDGDAETGITILIHAFGEATNISIYNTGTRETMHIDTDKLAESTGSGLKAGDDIIICTISGRKSIVLRRDGVTTNILNCLERDSDWFKLSKGDNVFAYTAETGSSNLHFSIETNVVYEGI